MFFKEEIVVEGSARSAKVMDNSTTMLKSIIGVLVILTVASIFLVEPLIEFASYYVQISGY